MKRAPPPSPAAAAGAAAQEAALEAAEERSYSALYMALLRASLGLPPDECIENATRCIGGERVSWTSRAVCVRAWCCADSWSATPCLREEWRG